MIWGEAATERGRRAVGPASRHIAGSRLFRGLGFAVVVANAVALGLGAHALARCADSAMLAFENVLLGISVQ